MIYQVEGVFCHQESDRCVRIGDESTALCSRCLGVYFGFLMSSFLFSVGSRRRKRIGFTITALAAVGLIDIIFHFVGLYDTPDLYRMISGLFVGAGLGMVVFRFVSEAADVR